MQLYCYNFNTFSNKILQRVDVETYTETENIKEITQNMQSYHRYEEFYLINIMENDLTREYYVKQENFAYFEERFTQMAVNSNFYRDFLNTNGMQNMRTRSKDDKDMKMDMLVLAMSNLSISDMPGNVAVANEKVTMDVDHENRFYGIFPRPNIWP